jgi:peptide/nickel transport system substrate-binding protein
MSKRLPVVVVFVVATMMVGLVGSAVAQESAAPSPSLMGGAPADGGKITFTMGTLEDLHSANPFAALQNTDYESFLLGYDLLFGFGVEDLSPVSEIGVWPPTHSADGKTWTIKINPGLKWNDGQPLTAEDVAFTYNFINENKIGTYSSELGKPIAKNAFEAPDDTTLIWHMATPSMAPEAPPWIPIVPEHIWGRFVGKDNKTVKEFDNLPVVGSGPFKLTEWRPGQGFTFERNPNYWGPKPTVDEVAFRVYDNAEALKLALLNGEVDAAESIPPGIFQSVQGQPNITTNVATAITWDDLAFNFEGTADPSLQNEDVRKALAQSIDRQALVDRVLLGYGTAGDSPVAPSLKRWYMQPQPLTGYDPEVAKALLDQAGYKDTDGDGLRETPKGDPWSLEILAVTDWTTSVPEAKLIQGWFQDIGIDTTLKSVATERLLDIWGAQDFDMYVWGWTGNADPNFILDVFTYDQCLWWSDGCYNDPTYDKMVDAQATEIDAAKRQEIVDQAQQYFYEQNPAVVLLYMNDLQAYRNDRFTGYVTQPTEGGAVFYAWSPVSYLNIKPVSATSASASSDPGGGGVPPLVWIGLAVVVLIVIAAGFSRRKRAGDTE